MPSNHLIFCCPLLLLPSIFPSIRVFSNESALHIRWPKYRSFSFSISSVQLLSCVRPFVTPWTVTCQPYLSITNSWSLLKLMSIELVMPFNHLILCCPLLLPPIFHSIRVFFPMNQFFSLGGQSIGVSASASVLPVNIQDWFPLGLSDLISLLFKGLSRVFSSTTVRKHQFFSAQPSLQFNSHMHTWLMEKP